MEHLTEKEKEALKMFKQRLQEKLPDRVRELKLFGSKARGEATKHSDVDVLVVMEDVSWEARLKATHVANEVFRETGVLPTKKFTPRQMEKMRRQRAVFWQFIKKDMVPL
ncbi:MAG: nucleotidyltransferase domain-containing protein [bacterium]|nr:nucleotidyltransferase domain-containing protein [bacterium]